MNSYQKAIIYLKNGTPYQREDYRKIDELIEPLCNILNQSGFITLHSCSAHIGEKDKKSAQWYVLFVSTKSIKVKSKIVKKKNKKYNYKIKVNDERKGGKSICGLTRRWAIEYILWEVETREELVKINENIYNEFNKSLQIKKEGDHIEFAKK